MPIYIKKIELNYYRNFEHFQIAVDVGPVLLIGQNGTGKTNILEAISLLSPGRGLRYAKFDEICQFGQNHWRIDTLLHTKLDLANIISSFNSQHQKRNIEFNDSKISAAELSKFVNVTWITPQMEDIFISGAKTRRQFLDRIIYSFEPAHALNLNKYEHYLAERNKILQQHNNDKWLDTVEISIAQYAIKIAESRVRIIYLLQEAMDNMVTEFPKSVISIIGPIEQQIVEEGFVDISLVTNALREHRQHDMMSKKTNFGVHRSDLAVIHADKNQPAKYCSTGEQKALLVSLLLAHVNAIIAKYGASAAPILLLDEIFVHLDDVKKDYLIDFIIDSKLQAWITSTDLHGINRLKGNSEIINL